MLLFLLRADWNLEKLGNSGEESNDLKRIQNLRVGLLAEAAAVQAPTHVHHGETEQVQVSSHTADLHRPRPVHQASSSLGYDTDALAATAGVIAAKRAAVSAMNRTFMNDPFAHAFALATCPEKLQAAMLMSAPDLARFAVRTIYFDELVRDAVINRGIRQVHAQDRFSPQFSMGPPHWLISFHR